MAPTNLMDQIVLMDRTSLMATTNLMDLIDSTALETDLGDLETDMMAPKDLITTDLVGQTREVLMVIISLIMTTWAMI